MRKRASIEPGKVLGHFDICMLEGAKLRRGITYRVNGGDSVFLLNPELEDDLVLSNNRLVIYSVKDDAAFSRCNPSSFGNQTALYDKKGNLTLNGRLYKAVTGYKSGQCEPELARVYRKQKKGMWEYLGRYQITEATYGPENGTLVFAFGLDFLTDDIISEFKPQLAMIRKVPASVKMEVWMRDGAKCVQCDGTTNLHYDHIIPFSLGGTSFDANNIQLLCRNCNYAKGASIS